MAIWARLLRPVCLALRLKIEIVQHASYTPDQPLCIRRPFGVEELYTARGDLNQLDGFVEPGGGPTLAPGAGVTGQEAFLRRLQSGLIMNGVPEAQVGQELPDV